MKLEAWAVGITAGSREVPGRKGLWQETATSHNNNNNNNNKVKVKWFRYRPGVAQGVGRGTALLFHDRGTRRGWVISSTPWPQSTPGEDLLPIVHRRVGGPQGRSGRAKNLVPTGIRSQTVQPVDSRYTDWATGPTTTTIIIIITYLTYDRSTASSKDSVTSCSLFQFPVFSLFLHAIQ